MELPHFIRTQTQNKQTKLTQFFTPHAANIQLKAHKKKIDAQTALKGTPYHGLDVSTKNEFDKLSVSEIERQLQNCRDILNQTKLVQSLPDKGKRIKHKIQLLDEALIRNKARGIIREKDQKAKGMDTLRQRLDFGDNSGAKSKVKFMSLHQANDMKRDRNHIGDRNHQRDNMSMNIPRGLAKNLDSKNFQNLLNSIQSLSINPLDDVAPRSPHRAQAKEVVIPHLKAKLYPHQIVGYQWMIKRETHNFEGQPFGGIIADEMGLGS